MHGLRSTLDTAIPVTTGSVGLEVAARAATGGNAGFPEWCGLRTKCQSGDEEGGDRVVHNEGSSAWYGAKVSGSSKGVEIESLCRSEGLFGVQ